MPEKMKQTQPHNNKCGAKAKSTEQPCQLPAGWGTDHPGTGRCKFHGGCSTGAPKGNKNAVGNKGGAAPEGNKNALKHGAYETIIRERLSDEEKKIFDAISSQDDLKQELKILRFKLLRLLDPVEKEMVIGTEQGAERVTIEVDEVTKAYAIEKIVDGIRKIVKDMQGGGGDDSSLEALARVIQASRQRIEKEDDN